MSLATWIIFFPVVFYLKAAMFLPQIASIMSISWAVTGKFMICLIWTIHLKYLTDWYPSLEYRVFACSAMLICLLENPCLFLETVFISTTDLSVGLQQWSPDSCILSSMFGFSWSSVCNTNIWSMLSYVTRYFLISFW